MWPRNQSRVQAGATGMVDSGHTAGRYRAKAARRPFLFWWQAFFLLGIVVLLWSQLPMTAVFYEPRVFPPLPEAHASYVTLDPTYAAQTFRKTVMAWTLGGTAEKHESGLDFGLDELHDALHPPVFLEQGVRYPGAWSPSVVEQLAVRLGSVEVPSARGEPAAMPLPAPPQGLWVMPDTALGAVGFKMPTNKVELSEQEGHGYFYVETGADGTVEHVLVFPPRTEAMTVLARALQRAHATGAARGFVDVYWKLPK